MNEIDKSIDNLEKQLIDLRKNYSENHVRIADHLDKLWDVYKSYDKNLKAIENFKKSLEIRIKIDPGNKKVISQSLYNLSSAYKIHGDNKNAIKYFEQTVETINQLPKKGSNELKKAGALNNLGVLYKRIGNNQNCE